MLNYTLFFIRHGKLRLPYKDHSEMPFKVLSDLASSKLNPPIDKEFAKNNLVRLSRIIPFNKIEKIYISPSRRCQDTAQIIKRLIFKNYKKNIKLITTPELSEIKFNLSKIYKGKNKMGFKIQSVNDSVFMSMIKENKNCESANIAFKRISNFLKSIEINKPSLFITHDFLMRIIEIYVKNDKNINCKITYNKLKSTKRNLYLQGFATDLRFKKFFSF